MKNLIRLFLILPFLNFAQEGKCKDLKEGIFQLKGHGVYSITRTNTKQVEKDQQSGLMAELKIKWISECMYLLYDAKLTKPDGTIKIETDTVYNEIISIKGNQHKVKSWFAGSNKVNETEIIKVGSK